MDLILWRHAEAEPTEPDMARVLTPKGRKQAKRTASWLDHHLPNRCRILVSPAVRTVQTAEALGRKFKIHADLAPDMPAEKLLAAAGWPDAKEPVLIVGHQPTLGMAASLLIAGQAQPWSVKKSGAWWIACRQRYDGTTGNLIRAIVAPDLLIR